MKKIFILIAIGVLIVIAIVSATLTNMVYQKFRMLDEAIGDTLRSTKGDSINPGEKVRRKTAEVLFTIDSLKQAMKSADSLHHDKDSVTHD